MLSVALLAVAACTKNEVIAPTGVTVDKNAVTLKPGETCDLTAVISPANASGKYAKWTSSNTAVATVSAHGLVTAIAPRAIDSKEGMGDGTAKITASTTDGKFTATCTVTVTPNYITGVKLEPEAKDSEVNEYQTVTWKPTFEPADASYKNVSWESSNESIAKVVDGVITGIKAGKATITVTTKDGDKTASKEITVKDLTSLEIFTDDNSGEKTLEVEGQITVSDFIRFEKGKISWEENKSKLPRQAKILIYKDKENKEIVGAATVTQVEVKDFNGKWKFNAYTGSADDKKAVTVDTEFTAFEGENGNNILVTGLYQTSDVEGKVEVDFANASAKVGVYVSSKKFYNSGKGTNCVLLPECAKAEDSWNDDNLVKFPKESGEFSASDSDWIWFNYDFESGSLKYIFSDKKKEAQKSDKGLYYCGLSFGNVKAGAIDGTAPAKLYEARYNGSDANGMFFSK